MRCRRASFDAPRPRRVQRSWSRRGSKISNAIHRRAEKRHVDHQCCNMSSKVAVLSDFDPYLTYHTRASVYTWTWHHEVDFSKPFSYIARFPFQIRLCPMQNYWFLRCKDMSGRCTCSKPTDDTIWGLHAIKAPRCATFYHRWHATLMANAGTPGGKHPSRSRLRDAQQNWHQMTGRSSAVGGFTYSCPSSLPFEAITPFYESMPQQHGREQMRSEKTMNHVAEPEFSSEDDHQWYSHCISMISPL